MRNKVFEYPFVEAGISREQNICIIRSAGFEVPPKSGCYFCPFQKASEFKRLYKNEPELYRKVRDLEDNVNAKRVADFKEPLYLKNVARLDYIVQEGQMEIDLSAYEVFEDSRPCMCSEYHIQKDAPDKNSEHALQQLEDEYDEYLYECEQNGEEPDDFETWCEEATP